MNDLFWLTDEQMARLQPYFPNLRLKRGPWAPHRTHQRGHEHQAARITAIALPVPMTSSAAISRAAA